MYQAIATKFLGPTNSRGARIKASAQAGSITLGWDHALNVDQNHTAAARALAEKMGWDGRWVGGGAPDGTGNVYVRMSETYGGVRSNDCEFGVDTQGKA